MIQSDSYGIDSVLCFLPVILCWFNYQWVLLLASWLSVHHCSFLLLFFFFLHFGCKIVYLFCFCQGRAAVLAQIRRKKNLIVFFISFSLSNRQFQQCCLSLIFVFYCFLQFSYAVGMLVLLAFITIAVSVQTVSCIFSFSLFSLYFY